MANKLSYAPRTREEVAPKHEQETTAQASTAEEDIDPHAADARLLAFLEREVGSRRQIA